MGACKDCLKPAVFWDGEEAGKEATLQGVRCYISQPSAPTGKAVLLVNDVHGWDLKNTRLLADKYAAAGFTAVLPDVFGEDPPPLDGFQTGDLSGFLAWQQRRSPDIIIPLLDKVLAALQSDYAVTSVGTIGFCWGGRFSLILANSDKVKAAVVNHGSFIDDAIVTGLRQPAQFNASDNDQQIPPQRLEQIRALLAAKPDVPSDVKFFPGTSHGWTVRGDAADPTVGPAIVDAFERSRAWFQRHV